MRLLNSANLLVIFNLGVDTDVVCGYIVGIVYRY